MTGDGAPDASPYLHGTDPREQRRLSLMNETINPACLGELGLRAGDKVLDVGCGLGQFTRAMGRTAGARGRVVGIERSREQLAEAFRLAREAGEGDLAELRQGDGLAPPLGPEEWGTFDVAHARFLLEHVPDPLAVVRTMARAVRPGGRIVLADDDHGLMHPWPEPPGFPELWGAYMRTFVRLGNDPYVGRRLISLLHEAGAEPGRNTWVFFGGCTGTATFAPLVENLAGVLQGARSAILSAGDLDAASFAASMTAIDAWARRPDAALWYAICWAEGRRPA